MEINMKTLPEHYSDYFYESLLAELPEAFLVAEIGGRVIGYIMCKTGHVVSVAVLDEHRKKGIGRTLVEESLKGVQIKKCDELYLEVRCSNNEAVRLYEKMGFIIKQRLKSYYRDGEDAYLMAIEFTY
jgi:[ribosomal protein S18]-alanine N-acetyltransferase